MIVIKGNIPSKSNCYRIIKRGQHASLAKTEALKKYEDSFYIQLPPQMRNKAITGYFELYVEVYYPSQRSDLDNALKCLLDCLQRAGAIKNDNRCLRIEAHKAIDKENPRIEFELKEL